MPGTPLDNAVAESFFKSLKKELAKGKDRKTREEAAQDVSKYIEPHCNTFRMHSALDYDSPAEYERRSAQRDIIIVPIFPSHKSKSTHSSKVMESRLRRVCQ